ncbi:hypothetical protein [Tessaracoccus sp.]
MTEQMPLNQAATKQRLVEELTGVTTPVHEPRDTRDREPGDPEPAAAEPDTVTEQPDLN